MGRILISEKKEALQAKLNERAEAATNDYSATDDFFVSILCLWVKSHQ